MPGSPNPDIDGDHDRPARPVPRVGGRPGRLPGEPGRRVDVGTVDETPADLTLPGAVSLANEWPGTIAITFDPTVFATAQTITLDLGQLELSNTGGTQTITGPTAGVTVSGDSTSRVFQIDSGVTASISGLTITDGSAQPGRRHGELRRHARTDRLHGQLATPLGNEGGGLYNSSSGKLTLVGDTVSDNKAQTAAVSKTMAAT